MSSRDLTPGEVAALFRVTPHAVRKWAEAGMLPCTKTPSGHRRYAEDDVLALLAAQKQERGTFGREAGGDRMTRNDDRLLTPGEFAAIFRVDSQTVNRWAAAGRIACIRTPGGHRRYAESEVAALLTAQSTDRHPGPHLDDVNDNAPGDDH